MHLKKCSWALLLWRGGSLCRIRCRHRSSPILRLLFCFISNPILIIMVYVSLWEELFRDSYVCSSELWNSTGRAEKRNKNMTLGPNEWSQRVWTCCRYCRYFGGATAADILYVCLSLTDGGHVDWWGRCRVHTQSVGGGGRRDNPRSYAEIEKLAPHIHLVSE